MLQKRIGKILFFLKNSIASASFYSTIKQFQEHENYLNIKWNNGQEGRYLYVWLRENCPEFHTMRLTDVSKSRKIRLSELDLNVKPISIENHAQSLLIKWPGNIMGNYSSDWLRQRNLDDKNTKHERNLLHNLDKKILWKASDMKYNIQSFDFSQLFTNHQHLHDFLTALLQYGLVFIQNASQKQGQLELLTNLIGFPYITPYGSYFSVQGNPAPTNQAYTNTPLAFHMDEPYLQYAPQIQALHCIRAGNGGENKFVDGYFVAEIIRNERPDIFKMLSTVPVEYADEGKDYVEFFNIFRYPVFSLDKNNNVEKVIINDGMRTWYLDLPFEEQYEFYKALKYIDEQCNKSEHAFQKFLKAGDIVFFDNMRVLHGRTGFEISPLKINGERLLEGAYYNYDVIKSKIRLLRKNFHSNDAKFFVSF